MRKLTCMLIAALLIVPLGCGGGDAPSGNGNGDGEAAADSASVDGSTPVGGDAAVVTPPDTPVTPVTPAGGVATADPALQYVTNDFSVALVVRPADILGSSLLTELRNALKTDLPEAAAAEMALENAEDITGIDPNTIEQVIVLLDAEQLAAAPAMAGGILGGGEFDLETPDDPGFDNGGAADFDDGQDGPKEGDEDPLGEEDPFGDEVEVIPSQAFPTIIVTFSEAVDRDAILQRLPFPLDEATHEGTKFLQQPEFDAALYFSDDNQTAVAGRVEVLKKLLSNKGQTGALAARIQAVGKHDFLLAIETAPLRPLIEQGGGALPPDAAGMLAMVSQTQGLVITADLSGDTLLAVHVQAVNAEAADGLAAFGQGMLQQGKAAYQGMKEGPQAEALPEEVAADVIPLLDNLVAGVNVAAEGDTVTLSVARPQGFDKLPALLKTLAPLLEAKEQQTQRSNDLKQIGLAMHNYHDAFKGVPVADGPGVEGQKSGGLSWRVYLLPFLEEVELFEQFKLDEPWDSDHNKTLIEQMPALFGDDPDGKTSIHVFVGEGTPLGQKSLHFRDITDGTSNTLMVVEAGPDKAEVWTKPGGLPFDAEDPIAALGNIGESFLIAVFDGSLREIPSSIDAETLGRLIQHADGQPVELP